MQIGPGIELSNGVRLPVLGLEVFRARPGAETRDAVRWALDLGYRHIDTAHIYGNERDVGAALRSSGLPRDDVFVTTELGSRDHGYDAARARTPAEVVLRWSLQKGFVPLPKPVHRERIAENAALFDFELSAAEMARLDAPDEGLHVAWDPTGVP